MRISPLLRRPALTAILVSGVGCLGSDVELPSGPPFGPNDIIYQIQPRLISYYFRDTSMTGTVQRDITLQWLPDTTFAGWNCIGFLPRSASDTIGTFQFYFSGANQGLLRQTSQGISDTIVGNFLTGLEGTRGTYAVTSANQLRLFWSDADAEARYFHPSAVLTFIAPDTLRSIAVISTKGDSVLANWSVTWLQNDSCDFPI